MMLLSCLNLRSREAQRSAVDRRRAEWAHFLDGQKRIFEHAASAPPTGITASKARARGAQWRRQRASRFFPFVFSGAAGKADLMQFRRQISAIPHPGPTPPLSFAPATATRDARTVGASWVARSNNGGHERQRCVSGACHRKCVQGFGSMLLYCSGRCIFCCEECARQVDRRRAIPRPTTMHAWQTAEAHWKQAAGPHEFDAKRATVGKPRARVRVHLHVDCSMDQLKQDPRRRQLEQFLDLREIDDAKIEGVGADASARYCRPVLRQRGCLPERAWRSTRPVPSVEAFAHGASQNVVVFDASIGVDPRDVSKIEQGILIEKDARRWPNAAAAELKQISA